VKSLPGENDRERASWLRSLWRPGQWLMVAACAGYLVFFFWSNPEQVALVGRLRGSTVLWASGFMAAYFPIYSLRYQVLLQAVAQKRLPFGYLFGLMVLSRFLNQTAPQLGNAYRGVRLREDHGIPYTDYVASYVAFAWLDTIFNLVVAILLCSVAGAAHVSLGTVPALPALTSLLAATIFVPLLGLALVKRFAWAAGRWPWVGQRLGRAVRLSTVVLRDALALGKFGGLSLAGFVLMGLVFWFLFRGLGATTSAWQLSLFYALYRMTMLLLLTPGSLGIREVASGGLGGILGVGLGVSVAVTIIIRVLGLIILAALAVAWKLHEMLKAGTTRPGNGKP
jgi:uncharacterized membrane protein YbhN (UPF0104 family)